MKNFLVKYWKRLLALFLVIIVAIAGIGFYFLYNNVSLGWINKRPEEIKRNNNSSSNDSLSVLESKELIVPDKYKAGVFSNTRKINLPKDFKISVFAAGLGRARSFTFDDKNGIYLTDLSGRLIYLNDANSDSIEDEVSIIESGLRSPHGVLYHQDNLYLAQEDKIEVYRNVEGKNFSRKDNIITGLPGDGGHRTRSIAIGPDQKLYISIGSLCNVCEEKDERRATIMRSNLDGSNLEIYAKGLRNSVGIIFRGNELWSVDNGRDLIGDDVPPEEVNVVEQNKHYGWPYCYGRGITNPEFKDKKSFCETQTAFPRYEMQAHTAPLGLDFYNNSLPEELGLQDNLFVAQHGSWNRTTPVGYRLIRIDTSSTENQEINFATGWLEDNGQAWGRPVDVKFKSDGRIFLSDDRAGALYVIELSKR